MIGLDRTGSNMVQRRSIPAPVISAALYVRYEFSGHLEKTKTGGQ